ncbi:MAG: ATP-dependent Clp protease adaptor ClpS [Chloroflexi bacterium]|nr:ATP-dependent Clp protease adaptor ClpS [Chloroflexota bacterium]
MSSRWIDEEGGVATEQETRQKIDEPPRYRVLLHNDNYTTMDFVVKVLMLVFRKSVPDATRIMLDVHYKGIGVVGTYPREVAETKVAKALQMARDAQFPLLCTMEPE